MTANFLEMILEYKKEILKEKHIFLDSIKEKASSVKHTRYAVFKKAISKPGQINLIAEIKKASPSKGMLRDDFDLLDIARTYEENKAAAISVLSEDKFFLGKPEYVKTVSQETKLPVLTKDFIIDESQIYEAFVNGTSAVLLIVAILSDEQLKEFLEVARSLDIDCLVEVHDEQELNRALDAGVEIVGINNRNLKTFEVDLKVSEELIPKIPKDKVIVVESGIQSHENIEKFQRLGVHAVLIGETFMKAEDIGEKLREVMGMT